MKIYYRKTINNKTKKSNLFELKAENQEDRNLLTKLSQWIDEQINRQIKDNSYSEFPPTFTVLRKKFPKILEILPKIEHKKCALGSDSANLEGIIYNLVLKIPYSESA